MNKKKKQRLTPKQEKYVQGLIQGLTQREAYKRAYNAKNMSNNSIDREASLLLKNPKVSQRYEELHTKLLKSAEETTLVTAEKVIKEIASIAFDDISNYLEFRTEKVVVDYDENGEPIFDYKTIVELKNSKDINTKNISQVSIGPNGTFKFKMYCRDTALYKLADILGLDELQKAKLKLAQERFEHEKDVANKKYW